MKNNKFILLHTFIKDTKKTPKIEIEQAKINLKEYLERLGK
ncbi:MAG: type II toxin-antitoxin system RelE/ParE family toxin [Oscillospiraceae bacterium]|nr:type II toxin-antitoxin system RelE/ParE family toxin [Oscillospiraceae bacterium]